MTHVLFDCALQPIRRMHERHQTLKNFVDWPSDLRFTERPACAAPVIEHLCNNPGVGNPHTDLVRDAVVALAPHVEWRRSYQESEVGADFLQRFGWFELIGPRGHYFSQNARVMLAYWGPNLHYSWHLHEPEELYFVVAGGAEFAVEGEKSRMLEPGQEQFHHSMQPHALTTHDTGILAYVLWRGDDLDAGLRMR